jgi:acyl-CoA synthetase (AMP-forming)/AMP-acid ligase II
VEGAIAVLEKANCNVWIDAYETRRPALVDEFLKVRSMQVLSLPKLDELLDAASMPPFTYTKTFAEVSQEPFCMLHTSGTTGTPKPISWTHALIGTMDAVRLLPPTEGDVGMAPWTSLWHKGDSLYSSFPMSHVREVIPQYTNLMRTGLLTLCQGAGIIMDILMPALFDEKLADHAKIDIWSMVPSLVDELGDTRDVLARFTNAKFVCASGGQLSPQLCSACRILTSSCKKAL